METWIALAGIEHETCDEWRGTDNVGAFGSHIYTPRSTTFQTRCREIMLHVRNLSRGSTYQCMIITIMTNDCRELDRQQSKSPRHAC